MESVTFRGRTVEDGSFSAISDVSVLGGWNIDPANGSITLTASVDSSLVVTGQFRAVLIYNPVGTCELSWSTGPPVNNVPVVPKEFDGDIGLMKGSKAQAAKHAEHLLADNYPSFGLWLGDQLVEVSDIRLEPPLEFEQRVKAVRRSVDLRTIDG